MSSLLFLGTGPGRPVPGRFCSSVLLQTPEARVLVDAGEPCSQRLREAGVTVGSLDAVLLTHGHSDHVGGFPMLLQAAWLEPRNRPLPVYLPEELIAPLKTWLEAVYLPPSLLGFAVDFRSWSAGRTEDVASGVRVAPFVSTHLEGLKKLIDPSADHRFKTYGLAVETGGKRVVFSSDLGSPADLAGPLDRPCDVLVCELSHFSPEELFGFLRGHRIDQLVLTHLSGDLAGREEEVAESAREALGAATRVRVLRDGDEVEF